MNEERVTENEIGEDDAARMTFTGHLGELRTRMVRCCLLLAGIAIAGYLGSERIIEAIKTPLDNEGIEWVSLSMIEPMLVRFKIAFYTAIVVGLPYMVYQICAFVFPGLRPKERRVVKFALFSSAILGTFGMLTAFFGVFPFILPYLMMMAPDFLITQLQYSVTVTHIFKGIMGFAIAFQFPIVVLVFVYLGVLSPQNLKDYRKAAIVGIFIGCAVLTPPDPITMCLMAAPLLVLYEISIRASYMIYKPKDETEDAS